MTDFVKPLLKKNPSHFMFHVGTDDLSCNSPDKIVDSSNSLVEIVSSKGVGCSVSNLTVRKDRLSEKSMEVNRLLKDSIGGKIGIIDNTNLNESHPNGSGLHLNRRGSVAMARNTINCIKSLDLSVSSLIQSVTMSSLLSRNQESNHQTPNSNFDFKVQIIKG